jgi:hypothetical protein
VTAAERRRRAQKALTRPFASIDFDFRLLPKHAVAPTAEIERQRAVA